MAARKYRKGDDDFKQAAVRLVVGTRKPIAQMARELGVNEGTLDIWCAKVRRDAGEGNSELFRLASAASRNSSLSAANPASCFAGASCADPAGPSSAALPTCVQREPAEGGIDVGGRWEDADMDVSAEQVARVPAANLRVSRAGFGSVWSFAEAHSGAGGAETGYLAGVLATCRWLAGQQIRHPDGSREMPAAPASGDLVMAMPERIEDEFFSAVRAAARKRGDTERARGVLATLEWAWHGSRRSPVELPDQLAG